MLGGFQVLDKYFNSWFIWLVNFTRKYENFHLASDSGGCHRRRHRLGRLNPDLGDNHYLDFALQVKRRP
jgi:hypothetical protein